ncbi:hypothetical protein GYMLUDRAFT_493337 [Collybiopsis luxurians FD-317 M1]|uniref:F-box domain-containing protein n=1 Tax=Collybiopsis luxurians FD-317 M1 TaxID=944289 RepID=A0A0D0C401_9AGAR|nr:hypothetical protein GYMLUDRAFT_493337 [Collybiopsis luxurians FD-317 M1]
MCASRLKLGTSPTVFGTLYQICIYTAPLQSSGRPGSVRASDFLFTAFFACLFFFLHGLVHYPCVLFLNLPAVWTGLYLGSTLRILEKMSVDLPLESREVRDLDEWSTPERRRGDRILDIIPNEVYLRILSEVDGKKDMKNIALVCRFFASATLPRLFEELYLHTWYRPQSKSWARRAPPIYDVLREGSDPLVISACKHIRSGDLQCHNLNSNKKLPPSSLVSYLEDFQKLPNLTSLSLANMILSKNALRIISQLSKLASLHLLRCLPDGGVTENDVLVLADALQLDTLSLFPSNEQVASFDPLVVRSQLTRLHTNSQVLIRCLTTHSVVPPLQFLELGDVDDLRNVYELLRRVPTLTELKLDDVSWPAEVPDPTRTGTDHPEIHFTLPLSALPGLRRLYCSARLAYLFSGPHLLERISFNQDISAIPRIGPGSLWPSIPTRFLGPKDARLFFDSPNPNLRRLECLPSGFMNGKIGEKWHGKMQDWFPKLDALNFFIVVDSQDDSDDELDVEYDYEDEFEKVSASLMCGIIEWTRG